MNVELLRKIAAVIQEKPKEFDITDYHLDHKCGTTHCIGGWAEVLSGKPMTFSFVKPMDLLGLSQGQAFGLFHLDSWPQDFREKYLKSNKSRRARVTAARIEHFIETGGRE